ncbi:MAG: hypothetical protein ACXADL_16030 [Candidatus Thorarchaeota archaeon]|jgi:hypothetical protein
MSDSMTLRQLGQGVMATMKIGYQAAKKKVKGAVKKIKRRKVNNKKNMAGSYLTSKETKKAQLDSAFDMKIK